MKRHDFFSLPISGLVSLCEQAIVYFTMSSSRNCWVSLMQERCDIQKLDDFPQLWRNTRIISVCFESSVASKFLVFGILFFGIHSFMVLIFRLKDFAGNSKNNDLKLLFFFVGSCRQPDLSPLRCPHLWREGRSRGWGEWKALEKLRDIEMISQAFDLKWHAWLLSGSW